MNKTFALALLTASCSALASGDNHWGYSGHAGPEHWGELDAKFAACATGRNQSPIDISGTIESDLPAIAFNYTSTGTEILNNGHTVQVNVAPGSTITVSGHTFELKQFHFHTPSENHVEGRSFPMEMHLVHADSDGNLAVVAVMFEEGGAHAELAKAWADMPMHEGKRHLMHTALNPADLLPAKRDYYRFTGSLTTPPCSEGVWWLVMKHSTSAAKGQIDKFAHALHEPNNRPVQPVNARMVAR